MDDAKGVAGRLAPAIDLARSWGSQLPEPGGGCTRQRWEWLASVAAADLTAARVLEAHADALAILAESNVQLDRLGPPSQPSGVPVWGVYAAEGPGQRLEASRGDDGWLLTGTKPWCSAAGALDRALVTAQTAAGRRLFAVDLHDPRVATLPSTWVSRGLAEVDSSGIELAGATGVPIGEPGWYLERSGFAWGGIGVAACWYGGLVGMARRLWAAATRREPDQVSLMHLGSVDLDVQRCCAALAQAAAAVDAGAADGAAGVVLAERVRGVVAASVDRVLLAVGHAIGPAPLTSDEDHARRVADLTVYVRQHHAERDSARLGRLLVDGGICPW